jgi:Arc/MetJ-type ribon-helix-helix transcriptional regulator
MLYELPPSLQSLVRKKYELGSYKSEEHVVYEALLKLYEFDSAEEPDLTKQIKELIERKVSSGKYTSLTHVVQVALMLNDTSPTQSRIENFFKNVDQVYGLSHRGISYLVLSIGSAMWLLAFASRLKLPLVTLASSEFIVVLIMGLILLLAGVGIRVYEFMVMRGLGRDITKNKDAMN